MLCLSFERLILRLIMILGDTFWFRIQYIELNEFQLTIYVVVLLVWFHYLIVCKDGA